jgi:hypothetical protein
LIGDEKLVRSAGLMRSGELNRSGERRKIGKLAGAEIGNEAENLAGVENSPGSETCWGEEFG